MRSNDMFTKVIIENSDEVLEKTTVSIGVIAVLVALSWCCRPFTINFKICKLGEDRV